MNGAHPPKNPNHKNLQDVTETVFITNFPTSFESKDLWQTCNEHGTVADVYITRKLSKIGRRFAFVRFLKVKNIGSLVDDLNKIWIGSYHLFVAMARFDRKPNVTPKPIPKPNHTHNQSKHASHSSHVNPNRSYATALNGKTSSKQVSKEAVILKSVTLDASDLIEIHEMRNVILVKIISLVDNGALDARRGRPKESQNHMPSETSEAPKAKSSRASKSHSKAFSNHGSMIEALVTQIEMGKVLRYDMEGSTNDLKKLIEGLGAKHDSQRPVWLEKLRSIELEEHLDISQKAKVRWGIEADENIKFFHAIVNQKRRTLLIHGIKHEVSEVEIHAAICDCGSEKSPGPDGLTFAFYKKFWDLIKSDVTAFVQEFFKTGIIPKGCNTSFIALIPKISNPMVVSDFRPISLIGAQYKIIAKVMANRLAQVIDSVISREQTAFIKHRQILDGPLMVMHFMGFSEKWISWIKGCLFSATASILINGSPTCEYQINRGLRQGDPLSPFLFIIAMEGLHVAVEDAISAGLYRGITVNTLTLSHFFFADDALFIGEWSRANIKNMASILDCFHRVSGLKINFHKSNLVGIGVPFEEVNLFSQATGCNAIHSSFMYLGLPVDCNMANTKSWDPILDKFSKRLSKWKASLLSIGGRTTLLSSVLGAIGTYYFSLFPMPAIVNKKLETLRSNFFWGNNANGKKNRGYLGIQLLLLKIREGSTLAVSTP
ncbi:RNA-directed DNA polymerase, eukaryota, reverse transcriptase zinc-binding domain protein [Tanacetum coccineum]